MKKPYHRASSPLEERAALLRGAGEQLRAHLADAITDLERRYTDKTHDKSSRFEREVVRQRKAFTAQVFDFFNERVAALDALPEAFGDKPSTDPAIPVRELD